MINRILLCTAVLLTAVFAAGWYGLSAESVDPATLNLSAELQSESIQWDGRERSYHWYAPADIKSSPALVFVLHSSMSDGVGARNAYGFGFDVIADREGFIAVYPDGFERHWNGCRQKASYSANTLNIDDVGYIGHLIGVFAEKYNADRSRVFVTGLSNGGHLAMRLALEAPELISAIAPVGASMPEADNLGCKTSEAKALSFMVMNGTRDVMNPYEGGKSAFYGVLGDRGRVMSSQQTVEYWARLAGHAGTPNIRFIEDSNKNDGSTIEASAWSGTGKPSAALYKVHNGGHNVPHVNMRFPRLLGPTNRDVIGAELIWGFFNASKSVL